MKVVTWNVNNRVGTVPQQVRELGQREPDVVALQDVNYNAVLRYIEAFRRIGLAHILHTLERQPQAVPTGVLLASRFPLSLLPDLPGGSLWSQGCCTPNREKLQQHWARRTLFALLLCPWGEIELTNVYITPANHFEKDGNGARRLYPYLKLDLLAGVYHTLAIPTQRPRLLCGDFNTPQHERENGEIITWGYLKRHGNYILKYPRQHELELGILHGLSAYDLQDVYRRLHGYDGQTQEEGWSWCYRDRFTYRFDHLFASHELCPVQAQYLHRDFSAEEPNTKWVADTTYIWTVEGWLYLAVVLDLFSRMVVGWSMAATQDATLVAQALQMAIARRRPQAGLLHHSDRGSTYTSERYQALLKQEGMQVSMSRTADCYDNAAMESFFHSFKGECIDGQSFQTRAQAKSVTFDYIEAFYNRTRRHSTLQYMSPLVYEQLMC